MGTILITRKEIVISIVSELLMDCPSSKALITKLMLCSEEGFIKATGIKLKRIRKNLYYL